MFYLSNNGVSLVSNIGRSIFVLTFSLNSILGKPLLSPPAAFVSIQYCHSLLVSVHFSTVDHFIILGIGVLDVHNWLTACNHHLLIFIYVDYLPTPGILCH
jgi:hypothetical protein